MPKERTINPATAALKAQKKRDIKKSKSTLASQRTEKLARRNPHRLQTQIDALIEERDRSGTLRPRDKELLERLEREAGAVKRARERLGVKDDDRPRHHDRGEGGGGVLGKRRRDEMKEPESSDTDPDVRDIPMPKDTEHMPPIPRRRRGPAQPKPEPAPAQTVYSSAPQVRDLRKEATSRFVPAAVASKMAAAKGQGGKLLEPEEADALEKAGYTAARGAADAAEEEVEHRLMALEAEIGEARTEEEERRRVHRVANAVEDETAAEMAIDEAEREAEYRLMTIEAEMGAPETGKEERGRAERVLRRVEVEEVVDEDL